MKSLSLLIGSSILILSLLAITNVSAQVTIDSEGFESGNANWTLSGTNAINHNNSNKACNGSFSTRLSIDNTSTMTYQAFNATSYNQIDFYFCHKTNNKLETGEGFILEYFDGTSWITLRSYRFGTEFTNFGNSNPHSFIFSITTPTYTFPSNAQFRIANNTNATNERNWIDDVLIEGYLASAPEIDIRGNGTIINNGDAAPTAGNDTEFGTIITLTNLDHTFTIQNTGSATLNLDGLPDIVTISGNAAFTILNQPSAPSITSTDPDLTFVVRFAPTVDVTNVQAIISIDNNDSNEDPYTFTIQGSSQTPTPEINVTGLGNPISDGDSSPSLTDDTHFGSVILTNSVTKTYTIENTGTADLDVSSISINNIAGSGFSITPINPAPATITTGNTITFSVEFTPTSIVPNPYEAEVIIVSTDSDEGTYNFNIQGVGTNSVVATGPGDVDLNLQLWLRADEGTALTGTDVDSWTDQSSNGFLGASQGTTDAQYLGSELNFNPVLRFSGNSFYNLSNPTVLDLQPNTDEMTIITVVVTGGATTGTVLAKGDNSGTRNYQVWFGTTDRVLHHTLGRQGSNQAVRWGTIYALNEPKITTGIVSSDGTTSINRLTPYVNGVIDPADRNDGTSTGGDSSMDVLIGARRNSGNTGSGYRYNGDIAEVIIYDRDLSPTERQKVESYLAIKYGVTLGSNDAYWDTPSNTSSPFGYVGTSNDYLTSSGVTIWDGGNNAGFGYNVFGIARDDNSKLLQTKSKSVNVIPSPILTMESEAGGLSTNLSFLLVGNDGGNISLTTSSLPERATNILQRVWKARETTNDPGMVTLEFDLSGYSLTNEDQLNLFIADNASLNNYKNYEGTYNVGTDVLTFTGIDFEDSDYFTLGLVETLDNDYHMSFNGSTQYIDLEDNNDLIGSFTISVWVKRDANNRVIVSKGGASGYEFAFNGSGNLIMSWQNSGTYSVTSNNVVPQNIWHHVAVIYNQSTAKLYVDGIENGTNNINTSPVDNSASCFIGASSNSPSNFFSGEMDELRIWNRALSIEQLRFIMNQEIENSGGYIYGKVIPNTITNHETSNISWGDLLAYYPFTETRGNCLLNKSGNTNHGRLFSTASAAIESQTTPLPYKSQANGSWDNSATWANSSVQRLPNSFSTIDGTTPIDWNIVEINNNIYLGATSTTVRSRNCAIEALIINSGDLQVNGNTSSNTGIGLTVSHYLKLNGTIDLEGESQLIQTDRSDFDTSSSGTLERDQQGTSNTYLYNYWCSPVASTSNSDYTLPSIFTGASFLASGYNGTASPVGLADYWIWKYANKVGDTYSEWQHVRSTGLLEVGQGFTMKGPGAATPNQNYILLGQPNNGDFSLEITAGNDYLVGNPYPSAMDADEFIKDNISNLETNGRNTTGNVINGALYFWDHFANNSHYLADYEGGYATYTLMGGARAISNDTRINASNVVGTKLPERYIPVGQGFFVYARLDASLVTNDPSIVNPVVGGDILFKNSQRIFQKETVSGANSGSIFLKSNSKSKSKNVSTKEIDDRQKIRLMFDSPDGYHRELLVGADIQASNKFDLGYEALLIESNKDDMYWLLGNAKLIIQAVNNLDEGQVLPLGIKTSKKGITTIKIDDLKNISTDKNIYIHDKELNTYHDLRANNYNISLSSGSYENRFELTFKTNTTVTLETNDIELNAIEVHYNNEKHSIIINNPTLKTFKSVNLYNIIGQSVYYFNNKQNDTYLEYKTEQLPTGAYIIKMNTENGTFSKKVLIK